MTKHLRPRNRITFPSITAMGAMLALGAALGTPRARASDSVDHGSVPSGNITIVGRFENVQPSGIARLPDGRLVLSFPTSAQAHGGPILAVWQEGGTTLIPFPTAAAQKKIISPLGMTVDGRGRLWVIDEGMRAGSKKSATPALVLIDPSKNVILRRYPLAAPAVLPDSHINDVRVDLTHGAEGTAFVSDTSLTEHPALLAIDVKTGQARRLLADDRSVSADPGFAMVVDGKLIRYDARHPAMAQGGVNGIALSADSSRLFWAPFSSRRLYSAPTAVLADPSASASDVKQAVHDEGEAGVVDGMFTAPDGSIYMADEEHHGLIRRAADGSLSLVAHDPRLVGPDGLTSDGPSAAGPRALLMTVGQWSRLPAFHDGKDLQERPYVIARIALDAP
ncbi:L-dopachrome tautomerase-related protein [Acetobacteraceae bacterium LMG 32668]|uniref:L-dopachrome tautomerase-related protein n=2 Tax=Brytella acorum TaxID=2959299 RepID=A0AA35UXR9_9PROT|nr:L-dopachrome tautomerase-related protein [Brytella acorum]MDF3625386.1 L-dopachrome tautomerase-related protein [Brytella acorum]CAI9121550.1 L-dopachrome tautomerase-related protein [Brytella acorum]